MTEKTPLTGSQVLAAATTVLIDGGYTSASSPSGWPENVRLMEDKYGIVAVCVYGTFSQLVDQWAIAQGLLVDLISLHLRRLEPKTWEGYLVLFTTNPIPSTERTIVDEIRYDTNRVRKLVATGGELETLGDVRNALLPLLPLDLGVLTPTRTGVLDQLPTLLARHEIPTDTIHSVVDAFNRNESIVERLHRDRAPTQ